MPASLSICNYISLAFDCFANLELFEHYKCSQTVWVCVLECVFVPVCLFVFLVHVLNWFDLIDSLRFSMSVHPKLLAIWHFDSFVSFQNKSEKVNCECVSVCVCVQLSVSDSCSVFFRICEKFLKLLQVNIFLCPSQLFAECSLNWQLLCGIAFFARIRFFSSPTHTNWIINTPTFCIFPMWNSFPKSNTNAARATATEKFN